MLAADAHPPLPPGAGRLPAGEPLTLTATDGSQLRAWRAEAAVPSGAAVVVLPDVRGLFGFYERLAEVFAAVGVDAVAIDYFGRTAGTGPRGEDFDFDGHVERTSYDGVVADIAAGVAYLRESSRVRAVFTVGFCFGGSYAFLTAAHGDLGLTGAIGCYGGMRPEGPGDPTPIDVAGGTKMPVLGLFGGADPIIPAEKVEEYRAGLAAAGVPHSIHVYPGAPHSFFDRAYADYADECADAWQRMRAFIADHTPAG